MTDPKVAAQVHTQSVHYTEARVSELRDEIAKVRAEHHREFVKDAKARLIYHAVLITFGVSVSVALVIMAVSPVFAVIVTGGPSVLTEVIDYFKKF